MRTTSDRIRRLPAVLAGALLAAVGGPSALADAPLELIVANRSSHEVVFVDVASGEITARIPTGEGPHLLSNVSGGRLLATGYGEFPRPHADPVEARPPFVESPNSRVTLIDVARRKVVFDRVLENCRKPHASWIVGERGYVTCESERRVHVLGLRDGGRAGSFDTQQAGSHVLSFDARSRTLGVSNTGPGSLTLVDVDNGQTRIVPLAAGSEGALAIDGRIWVANAGDGSVSVVDPGDAEESGRSGRLCGFPIAFSPDPAGTVWLACFASAELVGLDPGSLAETHRLSLPDHPLNLVVHPQRRLAYVSYPRRNAVGEIDLGSGEELRRFRVGIEPDGLRWSGAR